MKNNIKTIVDVLKELSYVLNKKQKEDSSCSSGYYFQLVI